MKSFSAIVKGRVQGVGFRYFVIRSAESITGITGYAKNLSGGEVEVIAEGETDRLQQLIESIRQGPKFSSVSGVEVNWRDIERREYGSFSIKY